jgi:hypothetical protein
MPLEHPDFQALWREVHRGILQTALTEASRISLQLRSQYRFLAALLATKLNSKVSDGAVSDLRDLLAPLQWMDRRLVDVLFMLQEMKLPIEVIKQAVPDKGHLANLLRKLSSEQAERFRQLQPLPHGVASDHERIEALAIEMSQ